VKVPYSYLRRQFDEIDNYIDEIRRTVKNTDFTLGKSVSDFEDQFAELSGIPYAVGVASGTDALILSLKILGIGPGDEVITTPNTFISTVGAIVMTGAKPVFVDNNSNYTIDVDQVENAITEKTKAILPVHLTGHPADMPEIMAIAERNKIMVVEDAAQAILASIKQKPVGSWGITTAFSLHPLKNLNVWGDGGIIVTQSEKIYEELKLFRNHGLINRDEAQFFGHNSRLDSIQAAIGNVLIDQAVEITNSRINHAKYYDSQLNTLPEHITIPTRHPEIKQVFHNYVIRVRERNKLLKYLLEKEIGAKVHYPIPVHLQKAADYLGYRMGDFPVCEEHSQNIISLPLHQHLTQDEIEYVIEHILKFYSTV
tara:strand:- start:11266 stop:12372 length:1107 start_codon:yes stop_codon:yes gene_type:complete